MATFNPSKDAHLLQGQSTINTGASTTLRIMGNTGAHNRILMTFDLSSLGAITVASDISLLLSHAGNSGSDFLAALSRVTQPWVEAEVTWNIFSTGNSWATPGGDYTEVGQVVGITIPASNIASMMIIGSALRGLAQDAIDNRAGILDVILRPTEDVTGTKLFGSRENATQALRPLLTVNAAAAGGGSSAAVIAAIMSSNRRRRNR